VDVFFRAAHEVESALQPKLDSVHVLNWIWGGLSVTVPAIVSEVFAESVSVVPEIAVTVVPSLIPSPSARIPTATPDVFDTVTVF
jgi:hypothetical protein